MGNQKMRIKIQSYDHALLDQVAVRILEIAKQNDCTFSGPIPLPTKKEIVTVIRSPHKHKDSREQFEVKTHKRMIDIFTPSSKAVNALMRLDLPAGVDINIKV